MSQPARDMTFSLQMGSLMVHLNAEGVSWSPDVADDMAARSVQLMRELLAEAAEYGLLHSSEGMEVEEDFEQVMEAGEDG